MIRVHFHPLFLLLFIAGCVRCDVSPARDDGGGGDAVHADQGTFASARRESDGCVFEYVNDGGVETLRVSGDVPSTIDENQVMDSFRVGLGLSTTRSCDENKKRRKGLLDSFTEFFVSTRFGSNVRQYYNKYTSEEVERQVAQANEELFSIQTDLSKLQTQEMILKQRQAELGSFLQQELQKDREDQNPTVLDLVTMEDDRLALLETRLARLRRNLMKQKDQMDTYMRSIERKPAPYTTLARTDGGTRIYTRRNMGCPSSSSSTGVLETHKEFDVAAIYEEL